MPLIIDLTKNADINPVHMGVVDHHDAGVRADHAALRACLLMASKFVGIKFSKAMFASLPIYVVFFAAIAFTIFFPEVVLWLPKQLLPQSVGCFRDPGRARLDLPIISATFDMRRCGSCAGFLSSKRLVKYGTPRGIVPPVYPSLKLAR